MGRQLGFNVLTRNIGRHVPCILRMPAETSVQVFRALRRARSTVSVNLNHRTVWQMGDFLIWPSGRV